MSKGYLTTHVLDTAKGCPARGLTIHLYAIKGAGRALLASMTTNSDGRTDAPILPQGECVVGEYELVFAVGDYHQAGGAEAGAFLSDVPVRFHIADADQHYHVPLLLSPYGYSTYRGS